MFKFPLNIPIKRIFPNFYIKEIKSLIARFSKHNFLISRSRPTALSVDFGEKVFIDIDFAWQLFLPILQRRGYNPIILIESPKNLMSIIFSLALFYVIDNRTIDVIIPPYYFGSGKKSLKGKEYLLDKLISEYGQKAIRIWLGSAINWRRKETILDLNLLKLISKMAYRIHSVPQITNLETAISDFNGEKIKFLLSRFRKSRNEFYHEALYGII